MNNIHSNHIISRKSYVNIILALLREREDLTNQINRMYDKEWIHYLWSSNHPLLGGINTEVQRLVNT